jgi:hypothetical protein
MPAPAKPDQKVIEAPPAFSHAQLPKWKVPAGVRESDQGPLEIHAADADGDLLLAAIGGGAPVLRRAAGMTVTGRVKAPPPHAEAAFLASYPALAENRVEILDGIEGRGRKIDVLVSNARPRDLFRLLADVGEANIVVERADLPGLTVRLRGQPWDSLLEGLARLLEFETFRFEHTVFLMRDREPPSRKLLRAGRGWIDVRARDVPAADLAVSVAAVGRLSYSVPCDAPPVDLEIRRGKAGLALAAIEVVAGTSLVEKTTQCGKAATKLSRPLRGDDCLLATVLSGNDARALIRASDGTMFFVETKQAEFRAEHVTAGGVALSLEPEVPPDEPPDLTGARLAATLIDEYGSHVIVQLADGDFVCLGPPYRPGTDFGRLEVTTGAMSLTYPDGRVVELLLRPAGR